MARKRPQYKLACVGLSDGDRNVLISAINSFASALDSEFSWSEPQSADIHIIDVANTDGIPDYPVTIRYTTRKNGQPVDLWRPIRAQILIDTLNAAALRADEQQSTTTTRRYRGAVVETEPRTREPGATPATHRSGVIYRGHRID